MLAAAMRAQARVASPANKAALGQFCGHAALRLVRAVTPLQDFLGPAAQRAAWAAMPLEVVEVLLHHPELGVDVEETGEHGRGHGCLGGCLCGRIGVCTWPRYIVLPLLGALSSPTQRPG